MKKHTTGSNQAFPSITAFEIHIEEPKEVEALGPKDVILKHLFFLNKIVQLNHLQA